MDAGFVERLLGGNRVWSGPCVVIIDADSAVEVPGPDAIITGGQKQYAPRVPTGRLTADAVMLMREEKVLLAVVQHRHKDHTGQTHVKQRLTVVDVLRVVGVEFDHTAALEILGVGPPPAVRENEYRPGMLVG
jgi:hypothetical protein